MMVRPISTTTDAISIEGLCREMGADIQDARALRVAEQQEADGYAMRIAA